MLLSTQTVVDYLVSLGWRYKLTNRDSQKYLGPCPVGNHANDDTRPGFSVHANQIAFSCFKCGLSGGGVSSLKNQMGHSDDAPRVTIPKLPTPVKPLKSKTSKPRDQWQGATLAQLCESKGIDYGYAESNLGWKDCTYGRTNTPAVAIPYFDLDGAHIDTRFRVGVSDGTRMVTRAGSHALPYGLQNIANARAGNYIILQEGETDWATLDALAYNALGLPGVMSWKPEWTVYLNGIKTVYVWQESGGKPDAHGRTPGQQMVHRISTYRGTVFVLEAPPEGKDPCELRQKLGDEAFMTLLDQMMLDAKPYDAVKLMAAEAKANRPVTITAPVEPAQDACVDHIDGANHAISPTWATGSSFDTNQECTLMHAKAHRTSLKLNKPVNFMTMAFDHRNEFVKQHPKNGEFHSLGEQGVKLCDFCVSMDDPRRISNQRQMENMVFGALGQVDFAGNPVAASLAIADCGRETVMNCDVHGAAYGGSHKCRQGFCPNCGTQAASEAARVKMPSLEGDEQYYHIVFETRTVLPENLEHWGPVFASQIDTWQKVMSKASGWKESAKKIYSRAHSTYYGIDESERVVAVTTWKVMFHEDSEGCLSKTVGKILKAMDAMIIDEHRGQDGEVATLQIVMDFMTHLIGMDPAITSQDQGKVFYGHYTSTRGRHIFQAYGLLRKLITALPEPEPQICPIEGCGLKLREVLVPNAPSGGVGMQHEGGGV